MRLTADTHVLVRAITGDHERQSRIAQDQLRSADAVAQPLPALCELAWVLSRGYRVASDDIGVAIQRLIDADNVLVNRPAAQAGLARLRNGGDFADGVIAHEGAWLGADVFVSFDRQAVALLQDQGLSARLLA